MLRRGTPLLWIAGVAGALWLILPFAYPHYDTLYAVVWGHELAHGIGPDYGALQPPTPHPLADLWGVIVAPFGAAGASTATTVVAYLALGAVAYLVYRLGALWFDRPIGAVAALIVLTRPPVLSNGLLSYVDLPYVALVLTALVIETRRRRAGWPVLALLAVAGLLRPEAWIFSAAYLAYLILERDPDRGHVALRRRRGIEAGELAGWVVLVASAPLIWACFDLVTTGRPLYSFTETRSRVGALGRATGLADLLSEGPRQLGQVMQWPGAISAAAGLALTLALMRQRAAIGIASALLAGVAFTVLAGAGLAIIARYMLLGSALLCVFCAAALLGWRLLPPGHAWRRRWQLIGAAIAVIFLVQAPQQHGYLSTALTDVEDQNTLYAELHRLADSGAFEPGCGPISVPSDRAVPVLAAWLDLRPSVIVIASEQPQPSRGYLLNPVGSKGKLHYGAVKVPAHFRQVARNGAWLLYAHCDPSGSSPTSRSRDRVFKS